MILGNLNESTDAGQVDYDRIESLHVLRAFVKEAQKSGGDKEYRKSVDGIEISPFLERFVVEQRLP